MAGKLRLEDTLCGWQNMVLEPVMSKTRSQTMFCEAQSVSSSRNFPGIKLFVSIARYPNGVQRKEEDQGFQIMDIEHPHNSCGIPSVPQKFRQESP